MSTESYVHRMAPGESGGPLVFAFHGTGGDENQLFDLARDLVPGATVVAPRGDVSEHGAARYFRRTGEGIYDMEDLALRTEKMAAFVEAHKAAAGASGAVGLGYSNGANILASVLFARPGLFERVALMHPLIPFAPKVEGDLAAVRVLITAGRRDPICPPQLTTRLEAHLRALGADVSVDWHEGGHEVRPSEVQAMRAFLAPAKEGVPT